MYCSPHEPFKRQRDAVGLSIFSDLVELHTSERTTTQHHQLLIYELEKLWNREVKQKTTNAVDALHEITKTSTSVLWFLSFLI